MLLKIYPENPNQRAIDQVVKCLQDGGIIIYPTDTIYGIGCDIFKPKSIERITTLLGDRKKKSSMTFISHDLSNLSDYTRPIPNHFFKIMKKVLPGPFTFILNANNNVPKLLQSNKKTVEYTTDPELIYERYGDDVDIVIDGGYGDNVPSTVVDCTGDEAEVVREGKGDVNDLF